MTARRPRFIVLGEDNVAVALAPLEPGERLAVADGVTLRAGIPFGHKLAIADIAAGAPVRKYSEVIGIASQPIGAGEHVHVHNVVSARLPGAGDA